MIERENSRWLDGVTGCVAVLFAYMVAAGGNPLSVDWSSVRWYSVAGLLVWLAFPGLLTAGAIAIGRWPRAGRLLMSAGAVFTTVLILPYGVMILFSRGPVDSSGLSLLALSAAMVLLIIWCDVSLVMEARARRTRRGQVV